MGGVAWAQELRVYAASSLTDAFEAAARAFAAQQPGARVRFSFEGSSTLALQLSYGAPADVFASADPQQMAKVEAEGLVQAPRTLVHNHLVVIAAGSSRIHQLRDLAAPGVKVVLAAPEVPAGRYARAVLRRLKGAFGRQYAEQVLANVVSEETNVRQVALKVELAEADAALVYATDAKVAKGVRVISIPAPYNAVASYNIAALKASAEPQLAELFVSFVLSPDGQKILAAHGFQPLP